MIRLHLKTLFSSINPLNINFPNHLITVLDFPQIFIPTTQGGQIWAALMYVPSHRTKLYGKNSVWVSAIFFWNYL